MTSLRPLVWCDRDQTIRELRDGETLKGVSTGAAAPAVSFDLDTYAPMAAKAVMLEGGPSLMDSGVRAVNALAAPPSGVTFEYPTTAIAQEEVI